VIYGDIGTSPLYVYSSTFSEEPEYRDLLGALSLIIWSLTLIVTIKYVFIVLRADDEGEAALLPSTPCSRDSYVELIPMPYSYNILTSRRATS